jgi:hypothetical protein
MSGLPQELMRKISAEAHESSEHVHSSTIPNRRFRELMKVTPVDDRPKGKGIFSLLEEESDSENKKEKEKAALIEAPCAPPTPFSTPVSVFSIAQHSSLSLDIEVLFEQMASSMIMMSSSGETETTLFLDNPHFASSLFFGSRITIREFSTAPRAFNIEIAAASAAIAVLETGKQDLLAAFQNGKFNFSVHRLDTHLQDDDRPVLHRKENRDHDQQERKGGREQ